MQKKLRRYLLKKPAGPSEIPLKVSGHGFGWNNMSSGTDGPITCEACGTKHPERKDQSYTKCKFLGLIIVEECCGKLLDRVYRESGEEIAEIFLGEFASNPTNPRFGVFLIELTGAINNALKKLEEVRNQVKPLAENVSQLPR